MIQTTLLLALTGLVAAADKPNAIGLSRHRLPPSNLLPFAGVNSHRINFGLQDSCYSFQEECDSLWCIPSGSNCCGDGDGAYCEVGYYCTATACCMNGETCSGPPTGCLDGKELCDGYCIPEGAECCGDGYYCDAGDTCTSDNRCSSGSDEDSSSDDDDDSSSDDSSTTDCSLSQKDCDGYCIPLTGVCCGDGWYCDLGETCTSDGRHCQSGFFGGDDETSSTSSARETSTRTTSTEDETTTEETTSEEETTTEETSTEEETSTTEEETSTEESTTIETQESSTTTEDTQSTETSLTNGGPADGGNGEGAGSLVAPSILLGLVALFGFAL